MKILAIQNKMGIGDTVIFLPYIKAISKKFNTDIEAAKIPLIFVIIKIYIKKLISKVYK